MRSYYIRSATSVTAVAAAMILPAAAQAQVRSFDVPAQSASSGIREFARQAGIQVTLAGRDGEGRATNSVRGSFPVRAGLDQLLADTGLSVRSFDGQVAILAASSGDVAAADETITVTGSRISRPELESAMPVGIVSMERSEERRVGKRGVSTC